MTRRCDGQMRRWRWVGLLNFSHIHITIIIIVIIIINNIMGNIIIVIR